MVLKPMHFSHIFCHNSCSLMIFEGKKLGSVFYADGFVAYLKNLALPSAADFFMH